MIIILPKKHEKCNGHTTKLCAFDCDYCYDRSFASHEKSENWSNKNDFNSREIMKGSDKKCLLNCEVCKHEFCLSPKAITKCNSWCQYCNSYLICNDHDCKLCFSKSFASHNKSIFWAQENIQRPRDVAKNSHTKFIFNCEVCEHKFEMALLRINQHNNWCPYCSNKSLCNSDICQICPSKSFASHNSLDLWSPNNDVTPRNIFKNTHTQYEFKCAKCEHLYKMSLNSIVSMNRGCPYCAHNKLCNNYSCVMCMGNSFLSSDKAIYWSKKNNVKPRDVFKSANTKYIFNCNICKHEFEMSLDEVYRGNWYCYCGNKICKSPNCLFCLKKTIMYASNKIIYSIQNDSMPWEITKYSNSKCFLYCKICKTTFKGYPYNIHDNFGCPVCKHKTEKYLLEWLNANYSTYSIEHQKKFEWCAFENNTLARFDFFIKELNILIELDGMQHFKQVSNWNSCEIIQNRDIYKIECSVKNGYKILHILQEDVYYNRNNWESKLKNCIENIASYRNIIFIGNADQYTNHIDKLGFIDNISLIN